MLFRVSQKLNQRKLQQQVIAKEFLFLFCCWDKIPWTRQLIECRLYLGLWFQKENNPPWLNGIPVIMHADQSKKLRQQIPHHQQQARSTERKLDIGQGCRFTKPIPKTHFPQQGCLAKTSPVALTRKQVPNTGTCGDISLPNKKMEILPTLWFYYPTRRFSDRASPD